MHVSVFDKRYMKHVILFLLQTLKVSQEKVDALFGKLKRDLDTLRKIIVKWHNVSDFHVKFLFATLLKVLELLNSSLV